MKYEVAAQLRLAKEAADSAEGNIKMTAKWSHDDRATMRVLVQAQAEATLALARATIALVDVTEDSAIEQGRIADSMP